MLRGIGPRFYVEAGFLIVVAAVLAVQRVEPVQIVVVMLVAYLSVFSVELVIARRRTAAVAPARPVAESVPLEPEPEAEVASAIVAVHSAEPDEPVVVPVDVEPEAEDAPDELSETEWVDDPPRRSIVVSEEPGSRPEDTVTSVTEPEAEPEPTSELEPIDEPEAPVAPPALVAVAEPEPEPVAPPAPVVAEPVVVASFPQQPRSWNVWELERLVRSRAGDDPVRDEEWSYLLVYLRDFASPEGLLPEDFDALVRESFGDVLEAAAAR